MNTMEMVRKVVNKMGYYFDANSDTLYMSKAFDRKTLQYGSEEFRIFEELEKPCPAMTAEIIARKVKEKPLSYEMMKKFISLLPTAEADLKEMERQKKMSIAFKSPYKYMERWFNEKYPYHKELLVKDGDEVKWDVLAMMKRKAEAQNNVVELPRQERKETISAKPSPKRFSQI